MEKLHGGAGEGQGMVLLAAATADPRLAREERVALTSQCCLGTAREPALASGPALAGDPLTTAGC